MRIRRLGAIVLLLLMGWETSAQGQVAPLRPVGGPDTLRIPERLPRVPAAPLPERSLWEENLVGKLSASQAAYRNWTEGGISTLALTADVQGGLERSSDSWRQSHSTSLRLGFIQQDTLRLRKASDRLRFASALEYRGTGFFETFNPTLTASLRTQFAPSYNYDQDPFEEGREPPVETSDFLAPGTFTQTIGLTYDPVPWFTQRLSIGAKEVVVVERSLRTLYDVEADRLGRYEAGVESATEVDRELFERVRLQSSLELFAVFNRADVPDMIWENLLVLEVNSWLSMDIELAMLYDRNISEALQVKEVVSVGASVEIL